MPGGFPCHALPCPMSLVGQWRQSVCGRWLRAALLAQGWAAGGTRAVCRYPVAAGPAPPARHKSCLPAQRGRLAWARALPVARATEPSVVSVLCGDVSVCAVARPRSCAAKRRRTCARTAARPGIAAGTARSITGATTSRRACPRLGQVTTTTASRRGDRPCTNRSWRSSRAASWGRAAAQTRRRGGALHNSRTRGQDPRTGPKSTLQTGGRPLPARVRGGKGGRLSPSRRKCALSVPRRLPASVPSADCIFTALGTAKLWCVKREGRVAFLCLCCDFASVSLA